MPSALVFNPGSASLKFEVIDLRPDQHFAFQAKKQLSASIEEIGKDAKLLIFEGRKIARTEPCQVADMAQGTRFAIDWLQQQQALPTLAFAGVRVVHGGPTFSAAVPFNPGVRRAIEALEPLAPLHNRNSLAILEVLEQKLPGTPLAVAFDTAFLRTLPETAWRYPIHRETADRFGIRKFGFHGLSHRYMLECCADTIGKDPSTLSVVTLHLESGSSATAIARGQSIDNTMGLTPLEGLMMGTRSGSIDPAIIPYLMQQQGSTAGEIMTLLNKQSGLLGIAGDTFDTRELVKRTDPAAQLALAMFTYRVRLAVGAYLAALGDAEAVLFGGGIGEDTPSIRAGVCAGLKNWGLNFNEQANRTATTGQACLSHRGSRLAAWVIPVEEGLQIAHECQLALG